MTIGTLPVKFASYKWDNRTSSGYSLRLDDLPSLFRQEDRTSGCGHAFHG